MTQIIGVIIAGVVAFIVGFTLQMIFGKKSVDAEYDKKQSEGNSRSCYLNFS